MLAVTSTGSLFRIILPISNGEVVWHNITTPRKWWREYVIARLQGSLIRRLVQAQGSDSVAIGLPDGSLLRLDIRIWGNDSEDGMSVHV